MQAFVFLFLFISFKLIYLENAKLLKQSEVLSNNSIDTTEEEINQNQKDGKYVVEIAGNSDDKKVKLYF